MWGNWKTEVAESKDSRRVVIENLEIDGGFWKLIEQICDAWC